MWERAQRVRLRRALWAVGFVLLIAGLGCNLSGLLLEQLVEPEGVETAPTATRRATATPLAPSTKTPVPSQTDGEKTTTVAPVQALPNEGEAANALEAHLRREVGPAL
jgi:hypothetical protein